MTWLWGLIAAMAMLWPDPVRGPFDGVPLDRVAEAVLVGFIFPALWWFHPRFLETTRARACIVVLVGWKVCSLAFFVPEGWCVRFEPARPFAKDAGRAPHAWDLRADWRAPDPRWVIPATIRRPTASFRRWIGPPFPQRSLVVTILPR